jgi:hypothetical protein
MAITKDKLVSLAAFVLVVGVFASLLTAEGVFTPAVFIMAMISLLGLGLIWFAEPLAEIGSFSRGIPLPSPPTMIQTFGWLFMLGYPVAMLCIMHWAYVWER